MWRLLYRYAAARADTKLRCSPLAICRPGVIVISEDGDTARVGLALSFYFLLLCGTKNCIDKRN